MKITRLALASVALALATCGFVSTAATGAAADSAPTPQYKVSFKLSAKEAVAKQDVVKLTGVVSPRPPADSTVMIQAKYEDSAVWKRVGFAPVRADGSYKFKEKPGTRLDRVYRVVKKTDAVATAGKSRELALHVIKWEWLTRMVPSAGEGFVSAAVLPINGDDYPHTLYGGTDTKSGFAEFTLGRNCSRLEVTFGLSDRTETGGQAVLRATADGVMTYNRTFDLGQSELRNFNVSDVYRIRFDFGQIVTTPATEPALGSARVLCD
jgi:hypothetical protein